MTGSAVSGGRARRRAGPAGLLALAAGLASCGGEARTGAPPGDAGAEGFEGGSSAAPDAEAPYAGPADKVDLLFVIDNSISMADKQDILRDAFPDLLHRLVNPVCVDGSGASSPPPEGPGADCPPGFERELEPVADIHVGIVTSSLGSSAASTCGDGSTPESEQDDDHGLLLGVRPRASGLDLGAHGFLAWRPGDPEATPADIDAFNATFQDLLAVAGERGCGFEQPLEAWYRFLVEPNPPESVEQVDCPDDPDHQCARPVGILDELLEQRRAFLRSDSVLAIVMLSDEDDCSTPITGQSFRALQVIDLPRGTTVCGTNPNDPCCHACDRPPPDGCAADPICDENGGLMPRDLDQLNQRCFAQKQRFGADFKYPTDRYVNALTQRVLCGHPDVLDLDPDRCPSGGDHLFRNPIYSDLSGEGRGIRPLARVFLAAVVGVPWQNIARSADPAEPLTYKTAREMAADGTWDDILADPEASPPVPPREPLMIESLEPREGTTRSTREPLAPPSAGYMENSINGHERRNPLLDELQYACIFRLPESAHRDCAEVDYRQVGCDCHPEIQVPGDNDPLCQNPDGSYGSVQRYAKAYPGPRFLKVARDFGHRSVVASICARNLEDPTTQDYGYRPAVEALIDRMKGALRPQ